MKRIIANNIKRSADRNPDNCAFKQLEKSIDYSSLVQKASQLANFLHHLGIKKGDRIGIFMNRAFESSYAVYGVMLAGAVYVPIDTNLPPIRVKELVNDCDITTIISTDLFKSKLAPICVQAPSISFVIGVASLEIENLHAFSWSEVFEYKDTTPHINIQEEDLAYIIYTSGTTGKSKGIVHTHYSGYSYAKLSADLYNIKASDILGNHSHLHYDISTMGYLTMPYAGGCTVIVPEVHTMFPMSLVKLIESEALTIWYSVPLALIQMIKTGALLNYNFEQLRWVLFGGEIFATKYFKTLYRSFPNAKYSNVYGPAEVNQCTYYNFEKNTPLGEYIPLGEAWPETKIKISDQSVNEENEKMGELLVASTTRMKAYWGQEDLTKRSFSIDEQNTVFFKTGDVVKIDNNGQLIFIGRKDRQIKRRGYRVELNEIEQLLLAHPAISEAAVYAKKHEDILSIYSIIVSEDKSISTKFIQQYLSKFLPSYALPEQIEHREAIPRTSAGKVDYKQLSK